MVQGLGSPKVYLRVMVGATLTDSLGRMGQVREMPTGPPTAIPQAVF